MSKTAFSSISVGINAPSISYDTASGAAYSAYGAGSLLKDNLTLEKFTSSTTIDITELSDDRIVFDLIGVEAPIANALRRILISEVPSMAIEKVIIFQNTSIIVDEVLSHRLGLLPIKVDPREFQFVGENGDNTAHDQNTLVFVLDIECTRNSGVPESAPNEEKFSHSVVYSKDLVWVPQGRQAEKFIGDKEIRSYYDEIIIAKLRPGQKIEAELHVEKGIGSQHAKFSPVATATYRLLPEIRINKPIKGDEAKELIKKCPMKVFDIEDGAAIVSAPRNCSVCRECLRGESVSGREWNSLIELRRVRNHFIFQVETVGQYSPIELVRESLKILKEKSQGIKSQVENSKKKSEEKEI